MGAELEEQRGQIVGELTVVHAGREQRVPYRDVRKERRRGDDERAQREQGLEQAGLVEQPIGALYEQQALVAAALHRVTPTQGECGEPEILRPKATPDVGQDHAQTSL